MAIKPLTFQRHIVGPYGLFSDLSGRFFVGREVNTSSPSSEVLSALGTAPRFCAPVEFSRGVSRFVAGECDDALLEYREYVEIEEIDFGYGSVLDSAYHRDIDHLEVAGFLFGSMMKVFGGWKVFYREVVEGGGAMDLAWDEDGIDYERIIDYTVRLRITGGVAERLIKSEGYRLW